MSHPASLRPVGYSVGPAGVSRVPLLSEDIVILLLRAGLPAAAKRRGVSSRTLRRRFAQQGTSLREFVNRERAERAKALLATSASVAQVAAALGFSCRESFARFMRRELRSTASAVRRDLLREGWPREPGIPSTGLTIAAKT